MTNKEHHIYGIRAALARVFYFFSLYIEHVFCYDEGKKQADPEESRVSRPSDIVSEDQESNMMTKKDTGKT